MNSIARLIELEAPLSQLFVTDPLGAMLLSHRLGREARQRQAEIMAPAYAQLGNDVIIRGETLATILPPQEIEELRALKHFVGYG